MQHPLTNNAALPPELHKYVERKHSTHQSIALLDVRLVDVTRHADANNFESDYISLTTNRPSAFLCGNEAIELGEALIAMGKAHNARLQADRNGEGGKQS